MINTCPPDLEVGFYRILSRRTKDSRLARF